MYLDDDPSIGNATRGNNGNDGIDADELIDGFGIYKILSLIFCRHTSD